MKNSLAGSACLDDYFELNGLPFFAAGTGPIEITKKDGAAIHIDVQLSDSLAEAEFAGNIFPGLCI